MRPLHYVLLASVAVASTGCDKIPFLGGEENPAETARQYWAAMAAKDLDAAAEFETVTVTDGGAVTLNADAEGTMTNLVVADAEVDGDRATARTTMHYATGDTQADLDFTTTLLRIDGDWKVDRNATFGALANNAMQQLLGTTMDELGEAMGNAMGEAMQGMVEGMGEAMQDAAQGMAEGMANAMNNAAESARFGNADVADEPYDPVMSGTVDPGMTREQVVGVWGEPVEERFIGDRSYMYYRNGCERSCGFFDLVLLEGGQVVDAVVRGPGHFYSGISSSPPDRVPEETLPDESQSDS